MISRLASSYPEVEKAISQLPSGGTEPAAQAVARWALSKVGYLAPLPTDPDLVQALVDKLDDEYFDLEGQGQQEASIARFSAARAVHSMGFALKGDLSEAVYEAIAATDDPEGALRACYPGA